MSLRWPGGAASWLLLIAAAILPFVPALPHQFTFDDNGLVRDNPAVWGASPVPSFTTPYWPDRPTAGLYRPGTTVSYWLNARLTGRSPAGFRAVNLLLHAAVTLLLWRLLRRVAPTGTNATLAAALLFAVHPLHVEAVVSVIGRAELLAALLGLAAILAARRPAWPRLALSTLLFLGAVLSKESAAGLILLPAASAAGLLAAPEEKGGVALRRHGWRVTAAFAAALAAAFLARSAVLGHLWGLDPPSLADNALAHESAIPRALSALGLQWILLGRLLVPWPLAADHSYPQLVPSPGWMAAGALLLSLLLAAIWWAWRRRDRELLWGWSILLASGIVTANVLVPVGTILAERLAYLPSAGAIWLLAAAGARLHARLQARPHTLHARPHARLAPGARTNWRGFVVPAIALAWGALLTTRAVSRGEVWKDDLALFSATVADSPRSAKAWTNLAVARLDRGDIEGALDASGRALELMPAYPPAAEARATALTRAGRPREAVALLRPALRDPAPRARSLIELGNAYLSLGEGAPAETAFAAAAGRLPPNDLHVLVGRASAFALQQRWSESEAAWSRAASAAPARADVRRSWAFALWQSGAPERAEALYRELLREHPADAAGQNDLAWFLLRTDGDPREALALARRAFGSLPSGSHAGTLLDALVADGGCGAARAWADSLQAARPGLSDAIGPALDRLCPPAHGTGRLVP